MGIYPFCIHLFVAVASAIVGGFSLTRALKPRPLTHRAPLIALAMYGIATCFAQLAQLSDPLYPRTYASAFASIGGLFYVIAVQRSYRPGGTNHPDLPDRHPRA